MRVARSGRGRQWLVPVLLLVLGMICLFTPIARAEEAAVFADGMLDDSFLPSVDADLLAQESDPNYFSAEDEAAFLVEAAEELDGSVNTIANIAAAAGSHGHASSAEHKLPEMVKVSVIPMTEMEQKIVGHELDEKKLHLTALSEKLEAEVTQNTQLQDELESCQSIVHACEEKMREIDSLVHTIPECSNEITAQFETKVKGLETEVNTLKHSLSIEQERVRFAERNGQQVEIKLKLTKNELNVAKISLDQQRLAMDSTVLQYEEKFVALQKEVDRLNTLLVDNRRVMKEMKHDLSLAKDSTKQSGFWPSFLSGGGGTVEQPVADSGSSRADSSTTATTSTGTVSRGAEEQTQPTTASTSTAAFDTLHRTVDQTADSFKAGADKVLGDDESIVKISLRQLQKVVPFAINTIAWEYKWAYFALHGSWRLTHYLWNEYLQPFLSFSYDTLQLHVVKSKAVEVYDAYLKPVVERHRESGEDVYEHYVEPVVDFFVDKGNFVLYYVVQILEGEESPWVLVQGLTNRLQDVAGYLSGQSKLQSLFGSMTNKVVSASLYALLTLAAYYLRHPIAGLAMLSLVVAVLPLLLVVWVLLKVLGLFYDRKTNIREVARKAKKEHHYRKKTRSGGSSSEEIKDPSDAEPVSIRPATVLANRA